MNTQKIFLSTLFFALFFSINAQIKTNEFTKSLKEINVIVFDLSGNTTINTSQSDKIEIISKLSVKGKVMGLKYPEKRPLFETEFRQSNDTIFVKTPPIFKYKIIGINTYSEKVSNLITVPYNKKILIQTADTLIVKNSLSVLKVKNANLLELDSIQKSELKTLLCKVDGKLLVNGKQKSNSYEIYGTGSEKYILNSKKIILTIK